MTVAQSSAVSNLYLSSNLLAQQGDCSSGKWKPGGEVMGYSNKAFASTELTLIDNRNLLPSFTSGKENIIDNTISNNINSDEPFVCNKQLFREDKSLNNSKSYSRVDGLENRQCSANILGSYSMPHDTSLPNPYSSASPCIANTQHRECLQPAGPEQLVNHATASLPTFALLGTLAASLRELFAGCFGCPFSGSSSIDRSGTNHQKGAWFDCGQAQTNHGFTYCNPVIINSEENIMETNSNQINFSSGNKIKIETLERADTSYTKSMRFEEKRRNICNNEMFKTSCYNTDDRNIETVKLFTENNEGESISFATKLEELCKRGEVDIERSQGRSIDTSHHSKKSNAYQSEDQGKRIWDDDKKNTCDKSVAYDSGCCLLSVTQKATSDEHFFNECRNEKLSTDVWEDVELEEAFGIYNLNAFYSYGSTSPIILSSRPSKPMHEKFEEVFPASKQSLLKPTSSKPKAVSTRTNDTENDNETNRRKLISEDTLRNIIKQFLLMERDENFIKFFQLFKENLSCDNYFIYLNRRINKSLLFDLVNEQRLLYSVSYPLSCGLTKSKGNISDQQIENNVFRVLNISYPLTSAKKRIGITQDDHKYENDILINSLVTNSLRQEEPSWNNYDEEELLRKETVADDLLKDLLMETASIFDNILNTKCSNIKNDQQKTL